MADGKKYTSLDLADAQFIGYSHGKREPGILPMVISMGLTKPEWKKWKSQYTSTYLTGREIEEIDSHFGIQPNPATTPRTDRLYQDGERVIVVFNKLPMIVLRASEVIKGWRYELAFPKKNGAPNRSISTRFYFEAELQKI
jgi:hypothetical protein